MTNKPTTAAAFYALHVAPKLGKASLDGPEYDSADTFAVYLDEEGRHTYTRFEAGRVASKSGLTVPQVHVALQAYGYTVKP